MRRLLCQLGKTVHQSWLVVFLCAGLVAGVILGLALRVNYFASPLWIVAAVGLLIIAYLRPQIALVVLVFLAGMVLALFRISAELAGNDYIAKLHGADVLVSGVVAGDPSTDTKGTKLTLTELEFGEEHIASTGKLYISLNQNEDLSREDRVTLMGKLENGFGTYAGYMYRPKLIKWERPEPGSWVLIIRNWFATRIKQLIPEPEVQLGLSYLLGMKTGLPDELSEQLRMVGLVHIVVASGAHLSILVEVSRKIFSKLSRLVSLLFSLLFVVFFMSMVGWTPSILRAGLMTILTLLAWYVGREFAPWRIILIVTAVTLMINPVFITDLGWLLSFASFTGIMALGPRLVRFFYGTKKPGFISSIIVTTIAATLMTLPIVLYYYGAISLISVAANLLILPTLPYAMGLVFFTGVLAGIPGLELVISWCASRLLDFHIAVVGWFASMPEFLIEIPPYQWQVFLLYLLIIIGISVHGIIKLIKKQKINPG